MTHEERVDDIMRRCWQKPHPGEEFLGLDIEMLNAFREIAAERDAEIERLRAWIETTAAAHHAMICYEYERVSFQECDEYFCKNAREALERKEQRCPGK